RLPRVRPRQGVPHAQGGDPRDRGPEDRLHPDPLHASGASRRASAADAGEEVPRELAYETARVTWREWMHHRATDLSAVDLRLLFGHFEFQGVRYASTAPSEVGPNDFTFTPEMLPDALYLGAFGQFHMDRP